MRTGAAFGYVGNFHEAGYYSSDEEFLALIVPFITEGLAAADPVIIGYDDRKSDLVRAALPDPSGVTFIADKSLYASPARAIESYRQEFERALGTGAAQVRIAGDVPHEGNGGRYEGWDRYESAVNAVWQDYPVWSRCLYDATTTPDDVRDVVQRTHPRLVTPDGRAARSPRYQEVFEFVPLHVAPDRLMDARPPTRVLVNATPDEASAHVARAASGIIASATTQQLASAVREAVHNARRHGSLPTTVKIWPGPDHIVVTVHDAGPGPHDPLSGLVPARNGDSAHGGGLWRIHQMELVDVALTSGDGFTVRLRAGELTPRPLRAPPPPEPARIPRPDGPSAQTSREENVSQAVGGLRLAGQPRQQGRDRGIAETAVRSPATTRDAVARAKLAVSRAEALREWATAQASNVAHIEDQLAETFESLATGNPDRAQHCLDIATKAREVAGRARETAERHTRG